MSQFDFAPVMLGLASAASWGAGDFSGGLATKRTSVYGVVVVSQAVGAGMLMGLALAFGESVPPPADLLWGGCGGVAGAIGLLALYRALAAGRMGAAAPVSAVIAAAIPVVFGAFMEGWLGARQMIGFGLALVAVWLISGSDQAAVRVYDLGLPLVAGTGFGIFFIAIDHAGRASVLWPVVAARLLSTTLLAAHLGRLDVAAVLGSLYPASTVWLAWLILKERLTRVQWAGVGAALVAIVLIAV